MHFSWARLASFCHLGFISDPLIVSKFYNETHDPKVCYYRQLLKEIIDRCYSLNTVCPKVISNKRFSKNRSLNFQGYTVNLVVYAVCHSFSIFSSYNQQLTSMDLSGVTSMLSKGSSSLPSFKWQLRVTDKKVYFKNSVIHIILHNACYQNCTCGRGSLGDATY